MENMPIDRRFDARSPGAHVAGLPKRSVSLTATCAPFKSTPAAAPVEVGDQQHEETAAAMIALLNHGCGLPLHRIRRELSRGSRLGAGSARAGVRARGGDAPSGSVAGGTPAPPSARSAPVMEELKTWLRAHFSEQKAVTSS